ncbi:MAG: hypothetical protein R3C59_10325 [Planctomycetaceae bacterium]
MARLHQFVFVVSLLALSWLAMMAVHELGHVIGAVVTDGTVERVVLHPLRISRTDVRPNPHPVIVVWLGPILGSLFPLFACLTVPRRLTTVRHITQFFAGFCLIANGAYVALGAFEGVGDCGVMLQHGSPFWTLPAFGIITIPAGLFLWHGLGSVQHFLANPSLRKQSPWKK